MYIFHSAGYRFIIYPPFNRTSFNSRLLNKSAFKYNLRVSIVDNELNELKNNNTSSYFDSCARNIFEYFRGEVNSEVISKI